MILDFQGWSLDFLNGLTHPAGLVLRAGLRWLFRFVLLDVEADTDKSVCATLPHYFRKCSF